MLAPIALYPDPLLSQILMASTYPLEVVEAARWSRSQPYLRGEESVRAVQQMDWDASVKSLVAFPQILQMMDEKLDWTERLGDAFLSQEAQVMDTVQSLRQKAYAAGNLKSNDQVRVDTEGQTIAVEPASPDIVYVPYYDPTVAYGPWWWDDYPPIYWGPWPGYYVDSGFAWGIGIVITTGFFFGNCDWHHHRVNVININNYYYHGPVHDERHPAPNVDHAPGHWQHDPNHRRGVPYRTTDLRRQYGRGSTSPDAHRDFRGYEPPSITIRGEGGIGHRIEPGHAPMLPRPDEGRGPGRTSKPGVRETIPERGGVQPGRSFKPEPRGVPGTPGGFARPGMEVRPHAFEDIGRGSNVRSYSSRGHSSNEGTVRGQGSPAPPSSGNATGGGRMQRSR